MLDAIFSRFFTWMMGWRPEEFRFQLPNGEPNPKVPLTAFWLTVSLTIGYYVMILVLQRIMKDRKAISLKPLFALHNGMLSFLSLILLLLIFENLIPLWSGGLWYSICTFEIYPNYYNLHLLYYINYLFKYYELLDTVFLILSKKDLEFLHWYHHSMTLWLTYSQLYGKSTVQWIPITLNLTVHVLMYYYYCRAALGTQIWWKKYLTSFQITQFFLDLIAVFYCGVSFFIGEYYSHLGYGISCNASLGAVTIGTYILSSYFILFIHFYIKTYNKPRVSKGTNGTHTNGTKVEVKKKN